MILINNDIIDDIDTSFLFDDIDFDKFKKELVKFVEKIMFDYLKKYDINDNCICSVANSFSSKGIYFPNNDKNDNKIVFRESFIREIYDGNIIGLISIFHELEHFKVRYDIKKGVINEDLIRIIKEALIRDYYYKQFDYYKSNYDFYSKEKYVEICAIKDFLHFLEIIGYSLSDKDKVSIQKRLHINIEQYQNKVRVFRNKKNLNFEEVFDMLIRNHLEWLSIPQLSIEYYKYDNMVKRRTIQELFILEKSIPNRGVKNYINNIIKNNNSNSISKNNHK